MSVPEILTLRIPEILSHPAKSVRGRTLPYSSRVCEPEEGGGRRMLGMLKRHEVEILLKAGHRKTEVARLTGVSLCSVKRIAEESPVGHVDDAAERTKRQIGRPSTVQNFRKLILEILQHTPDL